MIALLLLAAVSPEAVDLGRQLASTGTLATIAPLLMAKETEELIAARPELSDAEKQAFRTSAASTANRLRARVIDAEAKAFAENLSVGDLRKLVAFSATEAAKRQRAATPKVMMQTMTVVGSIDFKGEATRDFCAANAKLCVPEK